MKPLKSVLRNGGKIEIWLSDYGLQITLRDVRGKSRGSINLNDLEHFLGDSGGLTLRERESDPRASSFGGSLESRVNALEAIVASILHPTAVDPAMNDIAVGLCGKPFTKLTSSQQDTVRQIASRAVVSVGGGPS